MASASNEITSKSLLSVTDLASAERSQQKVKHDNSSVHKPQDNWADAYDIVLSAVAEVKKFLDENPKVALSVHIDEAVNGFVMTLTDPKSGYSRQFPSEEAVAIARNIEELKGILFDSEA